MKGTTSGASNREQGNSWNPIELMGATEMKITTQIERAKLGLTNGIKHNTLAKFLGALVLGAAMVAVTAPGFTPGQVQASENQLSVQTELGEEWFNPVTGEPTRLLPNQIIPRSMGILARPLSIERLASCGPGEENFHSVTGENISEAVGSIKVSSFDLGEEYFNPVTGEETSPISGKLDIGSPSLGEEYYHPVSGELETDNAGMNVGSFGMAEENFHPITGESE